ncbi:hypothetical protein GF371_03905 [Candidatus Woesearchaeota archaeon]|nr:hypothetical protein [Candidatus Woesearchaeota archaeon]
MIKKVAIVSICLLLIMILSTFVVALKPEEGTVFAEPVLADGQKHPTVISGIEGSVAPGATVTATSTVDRSMYQTRAMQDGSFKMQVMSYADEYFEVEYEGGRITMPPSADAGLIGFQNAVDFGYAVAKTYMYGVMHPKEGPGINFANLGPHIGLFTSAVQVGSEVGKHAFRKEQKNIANKPKEKQT